MGGLCPLCYPQYRRAWLKFSDTLNVELVFFFSGASALWCDLLLQYWAGQEAHLPTQPLNPKGNGHHSTGYCVTELGRGVSSLNAFESHNIFWQQWISWTLSSHTSRNTYLVHAFQEPRRSCLFCALLAFTIYVILWFRVDEKTYSKDFLTEKI